MEITIYRVEWTQGTPSTAPEYIEVPSETLAEEVAQFISDAYGYTVENVHEVAEMPQEITE